MSSSGVGAGVVVVFVVVVVVVVAAFIFWQKKAATTTTTAKAWQPTATAHSPPLLYVGDDDTFFPQMIDTDSFLPWPIIK